MHTSLMLMLAAFLFGLILNPLCRSLCRRVGIVDHPDGLRKVHAAAIPLSGGYAILLAAAAAVCLLRVIDADGILDLFALERRRLLVLGAGVIVVAGMGAVDDVLQLRPRDKLLLQSVAACLAYAGGIRITVVSNPIGDGYLELGWFSLPATLLWFLSCMNALNLVDGMDGLAGGVSLFACVTMGLVSMLTGSVLSMFLCAVLAGAILAFLFFNFPPASVFLGDVGSMTLGFLIGAVSLMGSVKAGVAVALAAPIVALGLPAFDTALAIVRRWARGMPVSMADRGHIHHVLLAGGLSARSATLVLYLVCVVLGGTALLLTAGNNMVALVLLMLLGAIAFIFVRAFAVLDFGVIRRRLVGDAEERRRFGEAVAAVEAATLMLAAASTREDLWRALSDSFATLAVDTAECRFPGAAAHEVFVWPASDQAAGTDGGDRCLLELTLAREGVSRGWLRLRQTTSQPLLAREMDLVEQLRDQLVAADRRLAATDAVDAGAEEARAAGL